MRDLIMRILADGALLIGVAAFLAFLVRHWITAAIDYRFSRSSERERTLLEVEKQRSLNLLERENAVYPEIVELVYRLRNRFRDRIREIETDLKRPPSSRPLGSEVIGLYSSSFGEDTFVLTEKLYKFRAFITENIFRDLHQFKRDMQDAEVIFDRISRHEESSFRERYEESKPRIQQLYEEIDVLYFRIVEAVREHMEGILKALMENSMTANKVGRADG